MGNTSESTLKRVSQQDALLGCTSTIRTPEKSRQSRCEYRDQNPGKLQHFWWAIEWSQIAWLMTNKVHANSRLHPHNLGCVHCTGQLCTATDVAVPQEIGDSWSHDCASGVPAFIWKSLEHSKCPKAVFGWLGPVSAILRQMTSPKHPHQNASKPLQNSAVPEWTNPCQLVLGVGIWPDHTLLGHTSSAHHHPTTAWSLRHRCHKRPSWGWPCSPVSHSRPERWRPEYL